MNRQSLVRDPAFYVALLLILAIILLFFATYFRWINVGFAVGPFVFSHWFSWMGAAWIALYTPIFYLWRRRNRALSRRLLALHVFGNLVAVALITVHFTWQLFLPPYRPRPATGVLLYPSLIILVVTGFIQRFRLTRNIRYIRFLHVAVTITFYMAISVHVLHGIHVI